MKTPKTSSVRVSSVGLASCLVLLATLSPAWAQGNLAEPERSRTDLTQMVEIPYRSPWLSLSLSLGSTALLVGSGIALNHAHQDSVGIPLLLVGATLGPSVGHMYTGEWWRVLGMSAGRGASIGLFVLGVSRLTIFFGFDDSSADQHVDPWAAPLIWMGLIGYGALTLWDIIDAPFSALRFNHAQAKSSLAFAPLLVPPPPRVEASTPAVGLALSGRF